MKILAFLTTLITIVVVVSDLYTAKENTQINEEVSNAGLTAPKQYEVKELETEKFWREKLVDKVKPENVNAEKMRGNNNKNTFQLGGERFIVTGTFLAYKSEFVLLKDEKDNMIKLEVGQRLSSGAQLADVSGTIITFLLNGQEYKFKLFEKHNDD